jgi:hypothetical protein
MPYKNRLANIPRAFDKRFKLSIDERREIIYLYKSGRWTIRGIARMFEGKCSRRMIQFILFPERLEVVKVNYKKWRKDNPLSKTELNKYAQTHRKYKVKLQASKVLVFPFYCRVHYRKSDFKKSARFCHATLKEARAQGARAALRGCWAAVGELEAHPIAGPFSQEVVKLEYGLKNKSRRYWAERYAAKKRAK